MSNESFLAEQFIIKNNPIDITLIITEPDDRIICPFIIELHENNIVFNPVNPPDVNVMTVGKRNPASFFEREQ